MKKKREKVGSRVIFQNAVRIFISKMAAGGGGIYKQNAWGCGLWEAQQKKVSLSNRNESLCIHRSAGNSTVPLNFYHSCRIEFAQTS